MSELIPQGENAVANFLSNQGNIDDIPQRQGFIPYVGIAYGTSEAVTEGLAMPGDFVLEGKKSLGKSMDVIVMDFRLHLSVWNDNTSSTDADCYSASDDPQRGKSESFLAFKNQTLAAGCKLYEGVDLLLWIPVVNSAAVIYLKGTTYDSFAPIYTAARGGRLVKLSTRAGVAKKSGRRFFLIDSAALNRAVVGSGLDIPGVALTCDVAIPTDLAAAAFKKFKEIASTEVSSESNVTNR